MKIAIVGMGEVGRALKQLILQSNPDTEIVEVDVNKQPESKPVDFMHVCFPMIAQDGFVNQTNAYIKKYKPHLVMVDSTILPGTCARVSQDNPGLLVVHSPIRGQHSKLSDDMMRYIKWIASNNEDALKAAEEHYKKLGFNTKTVPSFEITEVAKLLDTTQYGILITWAQEAERIAKKFNVNYDYVREYGKETQQFYHIRPDITPGFVGGKCVRQNVALLKQVFDSSFLDAFVESNKKKAKALEMEDDVHYG